MKQISKDWNENLRHRVFKIFKASGMNFEKTVKMIQTQHFPDSPVDTVKKIVATQLREGFGVLIEDDGTYIRDPPNTNQDDDLLNVVRIIKGEKPVEPNDDEIEEEIDEEKFVDVTKEEEEEEEELEADKTDLSKLKDLDEETHEKLIELGIMSIKELASADIDSDLLEEVELDEDEFNTLVNRAQGMIEKKKKPTKQKQQKQKTEPEKPKPKKRTKKRQEEDSEEEEREEDEVMKPVTPPPTPKPVPLDVADLLTVEEQKAYRPILDVNIGNDGKEKTGTFAEHLATIVSNKHTNQLTILDNDMSSPLPPPPKPPKTPSPPRKQPVTPSKPPSPIPKPVLPANPSPVVQPSPTKQTKKEDYEAPPIDPEILRQISALDHDEVIDFLRRKLNNPFPKIY